MTQSEDSFEDLQESKEIATRDNIRNIVQRYKIKKLLQIKLWTFIRTIKK